MNSIFKISPHQLIKQMNEAKLLKTLERISSNFTIKREFIGEYITDEEFVAAYTYLYLPTNINKWHFVISRQNREFLDLLNSCKSFVDIGAGPATFSFAHTHFADSLGLDFSNQKFILFDKSDYMLNQAELILKKLTNQKIFTSTLPKLDSDSVFVFGQSINEMGGIKASELILKFNPKLVIAIEPGTMQSFSEMNILRSRLLDQNHYRIQYPCLHQNACPIANKNEEDWCHQVMYQKIDPELERICQMLKIDRKRAPFIAHIYVRSDLSVSPNLFEAQVVRSLGETKFSFDYELCLKNGDLIRAEILKKHYSKSEQLELFHLTSGDNLNFTIEKEMNNKMRIKKA